jgi:DNA replication and repair protein RecF
MTTSPSSCPCASELTLDAVSIAQLRNLEEVTFTPSPRVNVITGNNGQGKTSILEAIYLLATSRSFRTSRLAELVRHEQSIGSVRGRFTEHTASAIAREQSVGLQGGRRTVRLEGNAPSNLSFYATRSPVVVFDPLQMTLSTGPAAGRRTLLDRVTLFTHPEVATHRTRYQRALRERQRSLADRFPRVDDVSELDAFEALLAEHGAAVTRARTLALAKLVEAMTHAFSRIAAPDTELSAAYEPGGSEDEEEARRQLRDGRHKDARSKRTSFGPHRDDLALCLDGRSARVVASQGQHRAITLALKIAEQGCIGDARGVWPILLLDDVSSELDVDRTAALFAHLATTRSQIFLTTTRRDLIITSSVDEASRKDFFVQAGKLSEEPCRP